MDGDSVIGKSCRIPCVAEKPMQGTIVETWKSSGMTLAKIQVGGDTFATVNLDILQIG
jgi:hypothetical protein